LSYIIKTNSAFVSVKLTEIGREKISKGQLDFAYWSLGDSEVNYERQALIGLSDGVPMDSKILRPLDQQPSIKYFLTSNNGQPLNTILSSNINVVKATVNNKADTRGFFSANTATDFLSLTGTPYVKSVGSVSNANINGTKILTLSSTIQRNAGDFLLLKLLNDASDTTALDVTNNEIPLPYLWFKIQSTNSTSVTLDRNLPRYTNDVVNNSIVYIYQGGEIADAFGLSTPVAYWDTGTLSFDSSSSVSCNDVPIWNMNNVWSENLAGITGLTTTKLYEDFTKFGSYDYLGTISPYLEYENQDEINDMIINCGSNGNSYVDPFPKSLSIIHYTNNTISNFYGEFLYIDTTKNKTVTVSIPTIMYHRRNFDTEAGVNMGMNFVASGSTKLIGNSDIQYIDLLEDETLINDATPKVVGRVYPQLKLIVFHNDEIVASLSYKSNRNWTLPELSASLVPPTSGSTNGVLPSNKTMYLTYLLDNTGDGVGTTLPCQTYIKIDNNSNSTKDVSFKINDIDLLSYMRKTEKGTYDGSGFSAKNFKLIYQIVDNNTLRPDPGAWKVSDFTSTAITTLAGQTIDPIKLETQVSSAIGFILTKQIDSTSNIFDITQSLSLAANTTGVDVLQFGDERFFYGNIDTYIGATIYKTIFDLRISASQYNTTSNPTRNSSMQNAPNLYISEVGIYDTDKNLVIIGKLNAPIELVSGAVIMIEPSIDF
jgi:hypothetical protein